jgi:cobalt-zinc-cadmium efflux system outer membrane protein
MRHVLAASLGAALLLPGGAAAEGRPLGLAEALELGRARAARLLAAAGSVEEARGRLLAAARRLREDPVVELEAGRRRAETDFDDYQVAVSQGLEPAGRRRARVALAEAGLEVAGAELDDARRLYLGEVAAAFFGAAAADERLAIAGESARLAEALRRTVERRLEMGEATALAANRARTAAARARAEAAAAEAESAAALGALRALLGLAPGAVSALAADLVDLPAYDLDLLVASLDDRPDLAALGAAVREAEAQVAFGESLARPDFALSTGYEREEGADVVSAGVEIALPLARPAGAEERAVGTARAAALRARLAAARQAAEAEVRAAFDAFAQQHRAVQELERAALPAISDNEALVERSFEVGEIDLGELLQVRREILETRLAHLDLLLAARLAALELETRAGVLR